MTRWAYTKGLHDLGNGVWAYLQPDGSWGWSNAGLIVDDDQSMLVDTLFDLKLTGAMLAEMRGASGAAQNIGTLVNTHANGDHCFGNELVSGAEIVASRACAEEMKAQPAALLAGMMRGAHELGEAGEFLTRIFGGFDFEGIEPALPTKVFDGALDVALGGKAVRLIEVGPAHTRGDILVHVPADKVVFTGDILFIEGHPIIWAGPVGNWIEACDRILEMDVETVVPGHGPITDKAGVAEVKSYLAYIAAQARARFDAGMPAGEAARDIALGDYESWGDAERIVVNVATLYREFQGDETPADFPALFAEMAKLARERGLHGLKASA